MHHAVAALLLKWHGCMKNIRRSQSRQSLPWCRPASSFRLWLESKVSPHWTWAMLISKAWQRPSPSPAVVLASASQPATSLTLQFWHCLGRSPGALPWGAWFWCDLWKLPAGWSASMSSRSPFEVLGFLAMSAAPLQSSFMQQQPHCVSGRLSWQTSSLLGLRTMTQEWHKLKAVARMCKDVIRIPVVPHEAVPEVSKRMTLIDWTFVLIDWTFVLMTRTMCWFDEVMWLVLRWSVVS